MTVHGPTTVSGPIVTFQSMYVVAGSSIVTPSAMRRVEDPPPHQGRDVGQVAAAVDGLDLLGLGGCHGHGLLAAGDQEADGVGQVILALGVVVGQPVEDLSRSGHRNA